MTRDNQDLMPGTEQSAARDKWLQSEVGERCCQSATGGKYLRHRLELAFLAGIEAALTHTQTALAEALIAQAKAEQALRRYEPN